MSDTEHAFINSNNHYRGDGLELCDICMLPESSHKFDELTKLQPASPVKGELRKQLIIAFKEEHNLLPTTRYLDNLEELFAAHLQTAVHEAEKQVVSTIYGIANDLANRDPDAIGSISLEPYFANAFLIYQEYLKGDNYERINWKNLDLPTIQKLKKGTSDEQLPS